MLELERLAEDAEIDTRCIVVRDNGKVALSQTASKPYKMGQDLVVQIVGIRGCCLASRVYDATNLIEKVCDQPDTWYSDLIRTMVKAAYAKNVFVAGGASSMIKQFEEKIGKEK